MKRRLPKYCFQDVRNGKTRTRLRIPGRPTATLSGTPWSIAFMANYEAAIAGLPSKAPRAAHGRNPKRKPLLGTIYFVEGGAGTGRVKIGFSTNFRARLATLQTGAPVRLRLLATVAGTSADERALHKRFASLRLEGEWFRKGKRLVDHIEQLLAEAKRWKVVG